MSTRSSWKPFETSVKVREYSRIAKRGLDDNKNTSDTKLLRNERTIAKLENKMLSEPSTTKTMSADVHTPQGGRGVVVGVVLIEVVGVVDPCLHLRLNREKGATSVVPGGQLSRH